MVESENIEEGNRHSGREREGDSRRLWRADTWVNSQKTTPSKERRGRPFKVDRPTMRKGLDMWRRTFRRQPAVSLGYSPGCLGAARGQLEKS